LVVLLLVLLRDWNQALKVFLVCHCQRPKPWRCVLGLHHEKKRARRPAPFVSTRCNHCRLRWVWGVAGATVCMYWLGCPYNYNIGIRHTYTIISRWITVSPRLKMQRQRIEMDKRETQLFDILGILPLISLAAGVSWCSW
jgi:hypothetical protein